MSETLFFCLLSSFWGVALGGDKMYTEHFVMSLVEKIDRLEKEFSLFKEETATKLQEFQTKLDHSDQTVKELEDRLQLSDKKVGELTRDLEHYGAVLQRLVKQQLGGSDREYPFPPDEQRTNNTNPNHNKVQKGAVPIEIKDSQGSSKRLLIPEATAPPKVHSSIAFYAYSSNHQTGIGIGQTIHYKTVITNAGNGFDSKIGVFRAPVAGFYYFSSTLLSGAAESIRGSIVHNSNAVAYVFAGNEGTFGSGSNSVVLYLNVDDDVWTRSLDTNGHVFADAWCTFSGFLISN